MVKFFKTIVFKAYVLFLMAFTVWYGYFMFPLVFGFEGKEQAGVSMQDLADADIDGERLIDNMIASQGETDKTDLGTHIIKQPYIEGRFHHIGFEVEKDEASVCVRCHGNVPHDKSKEVRSFLNMHAFYTACESCHIRPDKGEAAWVFRWYNKKTGERETNPPVLVEIEKKYANPEDVSYPTYGNYGVKIAPGMIENDAFSFLKSEKYKAFVERYVEEEEHLTQQQQSQMKKIIHKGINEKPIECNQCHQGKNPYIPFAELGYPPRRVEELTNTSVVGMIDKYKEFYIPNFLISEDGEK